MGSGAQWQAAKKWKKKSSKNAYQKDAGDNLQIHMSNLLENSVITAAT